jgi:cytochrome oxidase Cu insertion factor (SCO1/SenC/PrrC family)
MSTMRTRAVLLLVVAVALLSFTVPASRAQSRVDARLVQAFGLTPVSSASPPPLSLERLDDGRTATLDGFRGRPVLVYFWATW